MTLRIAGRQENFGTFVEAVAAAQEGDTILVSSGTYSKSLEINKSINILPSTPQERVILRNHNEALLTVEGAFVRISGIHLESTRGYKDDVPVPQLSWNHTVR